MDAQELTEDVARIADEAADRAGSLARGLVSALGRLVGLLSQLLTVLPAIPSRALAILSALLLRLGTASAEQAGIAAPVVEAPSQRRRRAVLWFAGGFTAGAATGYVAAQATAAKREQADATVTPLTGRRDGAGATG